MEILDACKGATEKKLPAGQIILAEGQRAGVLYVLIEGEVEILKGDFLIHEISQPGAVFGEISVLLDTPHTATVRASADCRFYVIEEPFEFLRAHPGVAMEISRLLAERLHSMTTYLVDLKTQYEGSEDHFGMVDEVLETLGHAQRAGHTPGSDRDPDPTVS
jgi:CRP-like cAMP-binding protein